MTEPDDELAAAAAAGDRGSLAALVRRYRSYVHTIAWKITLNEEDAKDVTQSVFVRLVERIGSYDPERPFRPWLAVIAARIAVDHTGRGTRREHPLPPDEMERVLERREDAGGRPDERLREGMDREVRLAMVQEAMAALQPQQRAILALALSEDLKPAEIAERLGIPPRQVSTQLSRAVFKLRDILAPEPPRPQTPEGATK